MVKSDHIDNKVIKYSKAPNHLQLIYYRFDFQASLRLGQLDDPVFWRAYIWGD